MISLKYGFLFIHIPKTAGNSIQNTLRNYSEEKVVSITPYQDGVERFEVRSDKYEIHKHSSLLDYREQLGRDIIDGLFKFTCVRNPWERMISFYFSPHRGKVSWDKEEFTRLINSVKPVKDFISMAEVNETTPESSFDNMDYFIAFEELEQDFNKVCLKIGIPPVKLPHRNVSKHKHYATYYDDELIELVNKRFIEEIEYFGFEFGG